MASCHRWFQTVPTLLRQVWQAQSNSMLIGSALRMLIVGCGAARNAGDQGKILLVSADSLTNKLETSCEGTEGPTVSRQCVGLVKAPMKLGDAFGCALVGPLEVWAAGAWFRRWVANVHRVACLNGQISDLMPPVVPDCSHHAEASLASPKRPNANCFSAQNAYCGMWGS